MDPTRFQGLGMASAVAQVNDVLAPLLVGKDPVNQEEVDDAMNELDGTDDKSSLGTHAILSVSMAVCRAGAGQKDMPLYRHIAELTGQSDLVLPVPSITALSGGCHAPNKLPMQEFSIMPVGAASFQEALEWGHKVRRGT